MKSNVLREYVNWTEEGLIIIYTVSDVVESNGQFASKIMTPNRMH